MIEIGWELFLSPVLKIGVSSAFFQSSWKILSSKDNVQGLHKDLKQILTTLKLIWSRFWLLFFLREKNASLTLKEYSVCKIPTFLTELSNVLAGVS